MTSEEIKKECEYHYAVIKSAQEHLQRIRQICIHENTSIKNYSWRVGNISQGFVCDDCGEFLRIVHPDIKTTVT